MLIDPAGRKATRKYDVKGSDPDMALHGAGGEWEYVSNTGTSTLAAANLASGEVKPIPTDARPQGAVW